VRKRTEGKRKEGKGKDGKGKPTVTVAFYGRSKCSASRKCGSTRECDQPLTFWAREKGRRKGKKKKRGDLARAAYSRTFSDMLFRDFHAKFAFKLAHKGKKKGKGEEKKKGGGGGERERH